MSVNITIDKAIKRYGELTIIPDLSVSIEKKELFTLLGPSGCGKTTLLRMIAGFNTIEGGEFSFNEKMINDVDVSKRNIGMVFQNYAIFPHLTVKQNVEFGLKNRKLTKAVIKEETDKFLKLMQIYDYRDRMPEQLSGGQQQRVALARALVIKPDVLLMDEPLSNLDAKLRLEMRQVIRDVQKEVGITTVYVTHDQEEAMAISDRIAVMKDGVIQHVGTPQDIYHRPKNIFVATFIGRTNFLNAKYHLDSKTVEFGAFEIDASSIPLNQDSNVILSVRPEDFLFVDGEKGQLFGTVKDSVFLGLNTHVIVELDYNKQRIEIIHESSYENSLNPGARVGLNIKDSKINIFSGDGERNLRREV
ncbi:MAG: polyamine ABC transporter ATP-binding protein [Spirochaetaceae bacterium 4572_7]|nr:MAG: polyamine ABC transporter ATP-binding protein [Spirochaetaceae bacterium 4572_7]